MPSKTRGPTGDGKALAIVVAVGASAGGFDSFQRLLRGLPTDAGIALVLVQHLDPHHTSSLVELLQPATPMPVTQVDGDTPVEKDHVYVISPQRAIELDGHVLRAPERHARGPSQLVDQLFRSVAASCGPRAIAVVLSGNGTDGALGCQAVKAEGGFTFAEDPAGARYPSMPRAAIDAGVVDVVLSTDRMAEDIGRFARRLAAGSVEGDPASREDEDLAKVFALLRVAMGVDFTFYRHTTIRRRIDRRMVLHKAPTMRAYLRVLTSEPGELQALYQDILIKVTRFFRDAEVFDTLRDKVLPGLLHGRKASSPFRVWVPGCSTGEEPYSIAILILECIGAMGSQVPVQIFATDVSEAAIEKARAGSYVENVAIDVSPERLARFFVKVDGGYQITKAVRDMCVFARQNLTSDPPFSKLDLISCRNVLIYLEPLLQKKIIPLFHYALRPGGTLVLGSSETTSGVPELFTPIDKKSKIYVKSGATSRAGLEVAVTRAAGTRSEARPEVESKMSQAHGGLDVQREADRLLLARFAPAGVLVGDDLQILQFRGHTGPFLEPAPGEASLDLLKMAREGLIVPLRGALQQARRAGVPIRSDRVRVIADGRAREIIIEVIPLRSLRAGEVPEARQDAHYLVLFEEIGGAPAGDSAPPKTRRRAKNEPGELDGLRAELASTREYLQSIIEEQEATNEELQSANEEILSSNEELQSINEELETAKEELQSTNEELMTVNEEIQARNGELSLANNDLSNLLSSVSIPIIMLGSDLKIRRFTPSAEKLLNLIPGDVGRPISDIKPRIDVHDLEQVVSEVVRTMSTLEREVKDRDGTWFSMRVRPYRTTDNRIDGAVVCFVDIDTLKRQKR